MLNYCQILLKNWAMNEADANRRVLEMTQRIIRWHQSPSEEPGVLNNLITQQDLSAAFHVTGGIDMGAYWHQQLHSSDFDQWRHNILKIWDDANANFPTKPIEKAQHFIRELIYEINHSLFFASAISVGHTGAMENVPSSDFKTSYHTKRPAWVLHATREGAATYIAGRPIETEAGDLLLIAPDASLHYRRATHSPKWVHSWVLFTPTKSMLDLMNWQTVGYGIRKLSIADAGALSDIATLLDDAVRKYSSPPRFFEQYLTNTLERVLLIAAQTLKNQSVKDSRVSLACDYIESQIGTRPSLSEIATHCNLSESRLAHLFKDSMSMSVKSYLDSLKTQRAKQILVTTSTPISTVGREIGYDDPAQFSKFFRNATGYSPRQYRSMFKEK